MSAVLLLLAKSLMPLPHSAVLLTLLQSLLRDWAMMQLAASAADVGSATRPPAPAPALAVAAAPQPSPFCALFRPAG
jgi:hypothetical protein